MSFHISPIGNDQFFDSNGNLLVGGKLFTYLAGTSTKVATYTDILGGGSHTNPIILNVDGMPPVPIYIVGDVGYKFVLAPASDTDPPSSPIYTWDNIAVQTVDSSVLTQWTLGTTPTYVAVNQFSVAGDQTATYQIGRRVKLQTTISTYYGWITASVFGAVTTVTVVLDSGSLDATLNTAWYSILEGQNTAVPNMRHSGNNTTVAADFITLGDVNVIGQDIKSDDGASVSSFLQFWVRVSSTLRAAYKWVSTSAFNLTFTHANTADRTVTFLNRNTTVDAGDQYVGPSSVGSGSARSHEGTVTISASQILEGVHFYTDFTLDAGDTLTMSANAQRLIIVASGTITINGTINTAGGGAAGAGGTAGATGNTGGPGFSQPGGGGGGNEGPSFAGGYGGPLYLHTVLRVNGGAGSGFVGVAGTSQTGSAMQVSDPFSVCGGAGGGSGGGGTNPGATGGSGGGSIVLIAPTIVLGAASVLNTSGSAGGASDNAAIANGAGGGGGAGNIYILCQNYTDNGCTFTQAGGAGGADGGPGSAGGAGAAGVKQINIYA